MMGRVIYIPDPAEVKSVDRVELFADVKDVCNVAEVAEAFGVCVQTVRRLIASGELASVHIGSAVRVTKTAMLEYITRQGGNHE